MQRGPEELTRLAWLLFALLAPALSWAEPSLTLVSRLVLTEQANWFGGISGAEVSADGKDLFLITDRGTLLHAELNREAGRLTGLSILQHRPIIPDGRSESPKIALDAEGLALASDGTLYVSFESDHRVARLDPVSGRTSETDRSSLFADFGHNSGIEALAIRAEGQLLAIPERSGAKDRGFPLLEKAGDDWRIAHLLPRLGPFLPTGADVSAEGHLYLLERALSPLGFRSRIRRLDLNAPEIPAEVLWTTAPGQFDNLESLTLFEDPSGGLRLLLFSDDNFLQIQRTEAIELSLNE